MSDDTTPAELAHLTEREALVAKAAAKLAVKEMQDEFYRQVGKNVINRLLLYVGIAFVAFAGGKGWLAKLLA